MEASMHGRFEKQGKSDSGFFRRNRSGFLILPAFIAIALLAFVIIQPVASNWIAETVQAEFAGIAAEPPAQSPTQLAQPADAPRFGAAN
jgi:hypothetical protein